MHIEKKSSLVNLRIFKTYFIYPLDWNQDNCQERHLGCEYGWMVVNDLAYDLCKAV